MKMLDRIHKIAEIVAAFAIVGSLLFVGIQMQQNTHALETGLEQNASHRWQEINLAQITTPGILEAWRASSRSIGIDTADQHRVLLLTATMVKSMEFNYTQWRDGKLSGETFASARAAFVISIAEQPAFESLLKNFSDAFAPDFVEFWQLANVDAQAIIEAGSEVDFSTSD
jgi:hypothetical protein